MTKKVTGKNVNDRLANSFVTMTANLQRLSESERLVVVGALKDLEAEIVQKLADNPNMTSWRKARYDALLTQNKATIATAYVKIDKQNEGYLSKVAGITEAGTTKAFSGVGIPIRSVAMTEEQLKSLARNSMIEGAPNRAWWGKQSKDLQDSFTRQMRMGYAAGETTEQLIQRVRGTATGKKQQYEIDGKIKTVNEYQGGIMDVSRNQASALVRTATQQIANDAKMESFRKNADIIKGVTWLSTLDAATTPLCRARDGAMWDLQGNPIGHSMDFLGGPPAHWNCRSTLVPVTKSWEELGAAPGTDKAYMEQIGEGTRASMDGQVPAVETFDSWFRDLPEEDQRSFLGEKKYEIWNKAGLNFPDMVDQRGNPLTVQQLADAYGYKIKESISSGLPNVPKKLENSLVVEQRAQALASEMAVAKEAELALLAEEEAKAFIQKIYSTMDNPIHEKAVHETLSKFGLPNTDKLNYVQYKQELEKAISGVQKDFAQIAKRTIQEQAGKQPLKGTIVSLGKKEFDISKPAEMDAYKKQKSKILSQYKKAVTKGEIPTSEQLQVYEGLGPAEKTTFDLKVAKAAEKAKVVTDNAVPPPGTLQMSQMEKIGEQLGSNPGGFYRDRVTGTEYYLKFYGNEDMARNELLASKLYKALGIDVPELTLIDREGQVGIASKVQPRLTKATPAQLSKAVGTAEGFGADAWLANWDAVGLTYDNLLLNEAGAALRVDVGGALRYRAQGGLKGQAFGKTVDELDSLRNPNMNQQSANVFGKMSKQKYDESIRRVINLPDSKIRELVAEYGPLDKKVANELTDTLIARKADLAKRFPELTEVTPAPAPQGISAYLTDAEYKMIKNGRINGYGLTADKNLVEDQNILAWFEKDVAGKDVTGISFKFREDAFETVAKKIQENLYDPSGVIPKEEINVFTHLNQRLDMILNNLFLGKGEKVNVFLKDNIKAFERVLSESLSGWSTRKPEFGKLVADRYGSLLADIKKSTEGDIVDFKGQLTTWKTKKDVNRDLIPRPDKSKFYFEKVDAEFTKKELRDGFAQQLAENLTGPGMESGTFQQVFEAYVDKDTRIRVWLGDIGEKALKNRVEILGSGEGVESVTRLMKLVEQHLGINLGKPDAKIQEELYLRMIARYRGKKAALERSILSDPNSTVDERIASLKKDLGLSKRGKNITETPGYNPQGTHGAFDTGKRTWFDPAIDLDDDWKKLKEEFALFHSVTGGNLISVLDAVLSSGGSMTPTVDKLRKGIPWAGMSPHGDMKSGGADYFFTRIKTKESIEKQGNGLAWKTRQAGRLDIIAYKQDLFGDPSAFWSFGKFGPKKLIDTAKNRSNEIIFKGGLSLFDDLEAICCTTWEERDAILEVLKKHGWEKTWVDGRPIEEVVRVPKSVKRPEPVKEWSIDDIFSTET